MEEGGHHEQNPDAHPFQAVRRAVGGVRDEDRRRQACRNSGRRRGRVPGVRVDPGAARRGQESRGEARLSRHDAHVVMPLRLAREQLHMGDIETALVHDLSDETPRRSGEARSRQVGRILGAASQQAPVVLVLDDAHCLHHRTLRALKRLRELTWFKRAPLLGIVLVGQRDTTAAMDEVRLRADHLWLEGLTPAEAQRALETVLGAVITPEAAAALSKSRYARYWLDVQAAADACLADARAHDARRVTVQTVRRVVGAADADDADAPPSEAAVSDFLNRGLRRAS